MAISRDIYRAWYGTARWKALRAKVIKANPWCVMCRAAHISKRATIADHIRPHKGNEQLFWSESNLQALCKSCHDGAKAAFERSGKVRKQIGLDGYPIDE